MPIEPEQIRLRETVGSVFSAEEGNIVSSGSDSSSSNAKDVDRGIFSRISRFLRCPEIMDFGRDVNFGCCCCSPKCSSILIGGICLVVCIVTTALLCTELVALESIENLPNVIAVKAEIFNLMVFTGVLIFISLGGCCLAIALLLGVYQRSTRLIFAWIVGTAASILIQFVAALVEVLGLEQPFRLYKFITMPFNIYFILIVHNYYSELIAYEDHKPLNQLNTQQEESS